LRDCGELKKFAAPKGERVMANGQAFTVVNAPQLKLRAYRRPDESGFKPCILRGKSA